MGGQSSRPRNAASNSARFAPAIPANQSNPAAPNGAGPPTTAAAVIRDGCNATAPRACIAPADSPIVVADSASEPVQHGHHVQAPSGRCVPAARLILRIRGDRGRSPALPAPSAFDQWARGSPHMPAPCCQ